MRRVLPFEFAALALLATLLTISLLWTQIYNATWIFGGLLHLLTLFVGLAIAAGGVILAFGGDEPVSHRIRSALAMPAVLVAATILTGPVTWLGYRLQGEWQLWRHGTDYRAAIARGGGGPRQFTILEGVPDGGVSLIYVPPSRKRPLEGRELDRLVNGNIRSCHSLRRSWQVCSFG